MKRTRRTTIQTVGVYEAKSRLSELVDRVAEGGEIVITRHGVPVARLVPNQEPAVDAKAVAATFAALSSLSAKFPRDLTLEELRRYMKEGRR